MQNPQNSQLTTRKETESRIEAAVGESMKAWYKIRAERDEALDEVATIRMQLVEAQAEKAIYISRHLDLEIRYETLLIETTRIKTMLEHIGMQADTISVAVAEMLALARQKNPDLALGSRLTEHLEKESPPLPLLDELNSEITPLEGERLQDLARRLSGDTMGNVREIK